MAAGEWLRAEQFGFKPEDEEVGSYLRQHDDVIDNVGRNKRVSVRPGRFTATQSHIGTYHVEHYAQQGSSAPDQHGLHPPIHIARYQDQEYVMNGHHRLAAAMQRGNKTARVKYTDLD